MKLITLHPREIQTCLNHDFKLFGSNCLIFITCKLIQWIAKKRFGIDIEAFSKKNFVILTVLTFVINRAFPIKAPFIELTLRKTVELILIGSALKSIVPWTPFLSFQNYHSGFPSRFIMTLFRI